MGVPRKFKRRMLPQPSDAVISDKLAASLKFGRSIVIDDLAERSKAIAPHFKSGFLPGDQTIFQFEFTNGEAFFLRVQGDEFEFTSGQHSDPNIRLEIPDHETCWGLLDGRIDGMQAFMEGRYRADGNIVLSQLLLYLFKSNDPTIAYEIQY